MKKTTKKESKKKITKKTNIKKNKNTYIIIISVVVLLLIALIIFSTSYSKTITCTKVVNSESALTENRKITFNMAGKNIKSINVDKDYTFNDDYEGYVSLTKDALENAYKDSKIKYSIKDSDNRLLLKLIYDKDKKYILNNVDVSIQSGAINVNVITNDSDNNYENIDLSKKYTLKKIKDYFGNKGYSCK